MPISRNLEGLLVFIDNISFQKGECSPLLLSLTSLSLAHKIRNYTQLFCFISSAQPIHSSQRDWGWAKSLFTLQTSIYNTLVSLHGAEHTELLFLRGVGEGGLFLIFPPAYFIHLFTSYSPRIHYFFLKTNQGFYSHSYFISYRIRIHISFTFGIQ